MTGSLNLEAVMFSGQPMGWKISTEECSVSTVLIHCTRSVQKAVQAGGLKLDKSLPQEDGLAEKLSQNFDHFFVALRKMGDYSLGPYAGVALHSDLLSLVLVRAVTYLLKRG
jgi:hypothetical protein